MAFILYEFAKHTEVQEKAYKELKLVLGEDEEADGNSLQDLPYLGYVIKETQRYRTYS